MNNDLSLPRDPDPSSLIGRRKALQLLGLIGVGGGLSAGLAGALAPDPTKGSPPSMPVPSTLPDADFRLLSRLVDIIIPPTETAGAVQAGVPQFIDAALVTMSGAQLASMSGSADVFADNAPVLFADGFRWIDDTSQTKHGRNFLELGAAEQEILLGTLFAVAEVDPSPPGRGSQFLRSLKGLTVTAYYTSEPGLMKELGYKGNVPRMAFKVDCDSKLAPGFKE
jgi:hypothetical protein